MVADAEANAESDKKAREVVDAKNQADAQIHAVKKELAENGDKLTAEQKTAIEDSITAIEDAIKTDEVEKITEAVTNLAKSLEPLYQAKQAQESATVEPGAQTNSENSDNVVDAEFTEVKKDAE